jgi:hypothetical protein
VERLAINPDFNKTLGDSTQMTLTLRAKLSRPNLKRETNMPDRQRLLELALKGLEAERATIDDEIIQIKSQLNHAPATARPAVAASPATVPPGKRRMSAAARRKISEAMKRRYAAINKTAPQVGKVESVVLKQSSGKKQIAGSRLTAAGRKKLSDLMKKRWAEKRKGKTK